MMTIGLGFKSGNPPCVKFRHSFLLLVMAVLLSCSTQPTISHLQRPTGQSAQRLVKPASDWSVAESALRRQDWQRARKPLARLVKQDLGNGHLQFLYALTEENLAAGNQRGRLDLAEVGYSTAARMSPGHYWALLRLGFIELRQGAWDKAQAHFADAALDQPRRWEAFYGLGVASYFRADLGLLKLATEQGLRLAPHQPEMLRLAAFSLAAEGSPEASAMADQAMRLARNAEEAAHLQKRVWEYLQCQSIQPDRLTGGSADGTRGKPATLPVSQDTHLAETLANPSADTLSLPVAPNTASDSATPSPAISPTQVVIEVTILLSSILEQENRGINLFDGLRVLYNYSNTLTQITDLPSSRQIISQISTPQLDYSLNLFNDSGQYYSVVARPSITAFLGRESSFFVGRVVNVELSSVNLASLEPIDVGVNLRVTPEQIDGEKVTVQISADRSFLSREQVGTFDNSLTTFRQSVAATADVRFGQTLVLSALSEQVADNAFSRMPGVGKIPVLNWFTNQSTDARRQESLLILVTPSLPLSFATESPPKKRAVEVERLIKLWRERINPTSEISAIMRRLEKSRWVRTPERGDLALYVSTDQELRKEALQENLLLAKSAI